MATENPKETVEVIEFAEELLAKLLANKADDGKLSVSEIAVSVLSSLPAAAVAVANGDRVPQEWSKMSEADLHMVATRSYHVVLDLVKLFVPEKKEG